MKKIILCFCIFFYFICGVSLSQSKQEILLQSKRDSIEISFIKILNEYRKQNNLTELVIDKQATAAALKQAEYCALINKATHNTPKIDFGKNNLPWSAENIMSSSGMPNSKEILNTWKESILHNQNLLNVYSGYAGLGYDISETGKVYFVLLLLYKL